MVLLAAFVAAAAIALVRLSGWSRTTATALYVGVLLLYAMPGGTRALTAANLVHLAALAVLIGLLTVLAAGHAAHRPAPHHGSVSFGYLVGITLLSAPTTGRRSRHDDGMGSLASTAAARRPLALVVLLLMGGRLLLAGLGDRAGDLVSVPDSEQVLPRLVTYLLPAGVVDS